MTKEEGEKQNEQYMQVGTDTEAQISIIDRTEEQL